MLDTQRKLHRLSQQVARAEESNPKQTSSGVTVPVTPTAVVVSETLMGWSLIDSTNISFDDDRYVGKPQNANPTSMAMAGSNAVAISDAGTDTIRIIRFP